MQLPEKLLESLQGVEGFERKAFQEVHDSGEQVTSIRINPLKNFQFRFRSFGTDFEIDPSKKVPWTECGYYLDRRPSFTFDPHFHAGCYYVQEASSMFLEQALKQSLDLTKPLRVLDISAAPGGKSTHIQSLISKDSLLVSNEVIRSRAHVLQDNIIKWGSDNVVVTNNDPKAFTRLENFFDAIVVDAPCSGSGLFRRDEEAIDEWSENNVRLCSQRQQRILADVWPALKKGGILIYSTCSYSKEENEDIVDWIRSEFRLQSLEFKVDEKWHIVESRGGYRFWPNKLMGEGFFIACVKKSGGENEARGKEKVNRKVEKASKKEMQIIKQWVNERGHDFVKIQNMIYAVPQQLLNDINFLLVNLNVIYFGTFVGELIRDKLIPGHALAMSGFTSGDIERVELDYKQAIEYLKKKDLKGMNLGGGWKLVTHQNFPLGWVNVLPNRVNNYYPRELRILKDI